MNETSSNKHSIESEGAKPRDHVHPRHHFWKRAHRDWRVWCAVILMIALIGAIAQHRLWFTQRCPGLDKLIEHERYIAMHGQDMPEIRNWKWSDPS